MNKIQKNEKGFSAVEIFLVIFIIVLIGVVGYVVYKNHQKTTSVALNTSSTKPVTSTKTATTNPYAGWLSYCDTPTGGCFYYPQNWKLDNSSKFETSITDPSNTTAVTYFNTDNTDQAQMKHNIIGQYNMYNSKLGLTIVGSTLPSTSPDGIFISTQLSVYSIPKLNTDAGTSSLTIGKSYNLANNSTFTIGSAKDVTFTTTPINTLKTQEQANTWLSNTSTKTAIQILQSLYIK